ncbi:TIGR01212 family radical SAM protein [Thiothrix fructosivorans]|uniref:TIGR01212 family radical SAM protein n=1 Tax=Thiothrix fructosivorans TaxID=111770 RepID=A0A8B0SVJ7_9GAMM|nr:TIGR01212 family radical SAM protein [Thiothrix fructosivorans]MBO0611448.1 TIGR01212 family radical SAM protein [Thiothrix fructosivorans]QTX12992.1 TIGR01212 family radical SAM protein [Thiothrix fructosivorans]
MNLAKHLNTFGQYLLHRHGERVHKLALNASFTCPNRDGSIGRGGCTFCNNASFNPQGRQPPSISQQIAAGRAVLAKRTGAKKFIAYFQAYTNTYATLAVLKPLYDQALAEPDVIGLSIGTRPDCVPNAVLDLLASYRDQGYEVWLELGLQSSFDRTLRRVNRGHGFAAYVDAVRRAHARQLPVCTHLIAGLPGEGASHSHVTLQRILDLGVEGLKLHPLHVVKGTQLANEWRCNEYQPLTLDEYVELAVTLIRKTPPDVTFHRVTATASSDILLAPQWCSKKWLVLNKIAEQLGA